MTPTAKSVVAVILHRLDLDGAEPSGVGDRGAGHAGKNHRAEDVDMREPATHPAAGRDSEIVDAVGDAGGIHRLPARIKNGTAAAGSCRGRPPCGAG